MLLTVILPLFFVTVGLAMVLSSIATSRDRALGFPRYYEPVSAGRRLLPVLLGAIITVCGAGMLVFSQVEKS